MLLLGRTVTKEEVQHVINNSDCTDEKEVVLDMLEKIAKCSTIKDWENWKDIPVDSIWIARSKKAKADVYYNYSEKFYFLIKEGGKI